MDDGSIFKNKRVYLGTPPIQTFQVDKNEGNQSVESNPSWRAWATAWVRLLTFSLP